MPKTTVREQSLHYVEKGTGFPLVLMHGFPLDGGMWREQVDDLASRCRVIAPDFPGFGQSTSARAFTIASMADDIRALLVSINALPCALAGLSMGGYVAMNFAARFGGDLRGLILVDTKDAADTPEQRENRNRMIEVARTKGSAAVAELMLPKMLAPEALDRRPRQVRALREMMEACPATTIEHALAALRDRPDMTSELAKLAMPALIIVGDADAITPPSVMSAMQQRMPRARMVQITGAGHMSPMEQPAQVNRALRQFMDETAPRQ